MLTAAFLARIVVSVVLATAGVAKLADQRGTRLSVREFGVPSPLALAVAFALPLVEFGLASFLLIAPTARAAATGALLLLMTFTAGIVVNLAAGRRPECRCFGQLHSAPVGASTVARNTGLAALAALVIAVGPGHLAPGIAANSVRATQQILDVGGTVLGVIVLVEGSLLVNVLLRYRRAMRRLDEVEAFVLRPGVAVGEPAPAFELPVMGNGTATLESLLARGRPVLLVFSDPGCRACAALLPDVGKWQQAHGNVATVAVVSAGTEIENRPIADANGLQEVLLQRDREVAGAYKIQTTPSAVLVLSDRKVAAVAAGPETARQLLSGIASRDFDRRSR